MCLCVCGMVVLFLYQFPYDTIAHTIVHKEKNNGEFFKHFFPYYVDLVWISCLIYTIFSLSYQI